MMGKSDIKAMDNKMRQDFRAEVKMLVRHKLDEINHYVSGVNSPFSYSQISNVQGYLCDIAEELGIKAQVG